MNKKFSLTSRILLGLFGILFAACAAVQVISPAEEAAAANLADKFRLSGGFEQELKPGEYVTIVDNKSGEVIDKTSRVVYVGDEIINEGNIQYRVVNVKGDKALAKKLGKVKDIVWKDEWDVYAASAKAAQAQGGKAQIAIYHTHSDESYVPTDGTESRPANGGIFAVGNALAQKLRADGVKVLDDKTPHEPHDANAYHRSRRTAMKLLQNRPAAILDVHRDGVPDPDFYNKQLQGQPITRIRLVVGRQNPNMATNLEFAKNIKAYMDKHKPGLIREIFIGKGSYNQDLSPRAMLIEVGTHTNTKARAENGAAIFADALPGILNIKNAQTTPSGNQAPTENAGGQSKTGWKTLGWIVGIVLLGGAAFLLISTGSVKGMRSKLGELGKTEFANFLGLKKIERKTEKKNKK